MLDFGFAGEDQGQPEVAPAPGAGAADAEPPDDGGEMAMLLAPWVISFLLHVGLVLLAVFVVWSVRSEMEGEEVIIPIARLSATPRPPLQVKTTRTTQKTSSTTRRTLTRRATAVPATLSGKVADSAPALGQVRAAKASPFDTGVRAGAGLEAKFFSVGGNARRLVYLVDASGSLIDTLPFVILELKRSIGELSALQQFTVIFFQSDEAIEVPPPGLKRADAATKLRVIKWIDADSGHITPKGLSNPVKALRNALRYKPQLLFILSDNITGQGRYEVDQRRLLADIAKENKAGTKINTIQFLYRDQLEGYGLKPTLQLIAERSGGIYKFLDGRELGIE